MKKIFLVIALLSANVFANEQKISTNYSLKFETGQRTDNMDWNFAKGNNQDPNILSELQWEDVKTYYGKITLYGEEGPYRLKMSYGQSTNAKKGDNQDSDYDLNNRQGEYSRSNNSAEGSSFKDFSIALGDSYKISDNQELIIWIAYEQNRQYFKMRNGYQTITTPGRGLPELGPFAGLDSSYDAKWEGGKLGLEYILGFSKFKINTSAYYHLMQYTAKANWNLRNDFEHPVSFKHELDKATGITAAIALDYFLTTNTIVSLNYTYKKYEGKNGNNTQYMSDGTKGGSNLNEINWESQQIGLALEYKF